jgi:hypothetical protein
MRIRLDHLRLLARSNPSGFGYELVKMRPEGPEKRLAPYKLLFHTSSESQLRQLLEEIRTGRRHIDDLPEPEDDFEPQLVISKDTHDTSYHLVKNLAAYLALMVKLVRENRETYYSDTESIEANLNRVKADYLVEPPEGTPTELRDAYLLLQEAHRRWERDLVTSRYLDELYQKAVTGDGYAAAEFLRECPNFGVSVRFREFDSIEE